MDAIRRKLWRKARRAVIDADPVLMVGLGLGLLVILAVDRWLSWRTEER